MTIVVPSISALLLVAAIWVVLHIDQVTKAAGSVAGLLARGWGVFDRTAVRYQLEGDVNAALGAFTANAPESTFAGGLSVKWVRSEQAQAILRDGDILVCMRRAAFREQNVAAALMAFLPQAVLVRGRRYVAKSTMRAIDLVLAKSIIASSGLGAGALQVFYEEYMDPVLRANDALRKKVQRADSIEMNGWITRILLPELTRYGDILYPGEPKAGYLLEAERFFAWLYAVSDRAPGVDLPLAFDGEMIRTGITMVARRPKVERAGINPYVRWVDRYLGRLKMNGVYLVGADEMVEVVEAVRDSTATDERVAEVTTSKFHYGARFRSGVSTRQQGVCVSLTRTPHLLEDKVETNLEPVGIDDSIYRVPQIHGIAAIPEDALALVSTGDAAFDELIEGLIESQILEMRSFARSQSLIENDDDSVVVDQEPESSDAEVTVTAREVEGYVVTWVRDRERRGREAYVSSLGVALRERFPGAQPLYERLGYRRVTDMLRDFASVRLDSPGIAMTLHVVEEGNSIGLPELEEVSAFLVAWLAKRKRQGREPLLSVFGIDVNQRWKFGRPLQEEFGYSSLRTLVEELGGFEIYGPRDRALIAEYAVPAANE